MELLEASNVSRICGILPHLVRTFTSTLWAYSCSFSVIRPILKSTPRFIPTTSVTACGCTIIIDSIYPTVITYVVNKIRIAVTCQICDKPRKGFLCLGVQVHLRSDKRNNFKLKIQELPVSPQHLNLKFIPQLSFTSVRVTVT